VPLSFGKRLCGPVRTNCSLPILLLFAAIWTGVSASPALPYRRWPGPGGDQLRSGAHEGCCTDARVCGSGTGMVAGVLAMWSHTSGHPVAIPVILYACRDQQAGRATADLSRATSGGSCMRIHCPGGGIGRHARLRISFRKECRFDPCPGHHPHRGPAGPRCASPALSLRENARDGPEVLPPSRPAVAMRLASASPGANDRITSVAPRARSG
jgi:hypothetical protein